MHRSEFALPLLALLVALGACGCASTPPAEDPDVPYPTLEGADFGGMQNVSQCGQVWVGSRPSTADLELAVRRGIKRVVDVTAPSAASGYDLAAAASASGLDYITVGTHDGELTDGDVDSFLSALSQARSDPLLVFCDSGGRAAKLFAIYRVMSDGVPLQTALDDARRGGMKPGADESFVREQVDRLGA